MGEASLRPGLRRLGSLLEPRGFRQLLTSQLLNQVADGLYQIALASVLIFGLEAARTPAQVTKVLAVTLLPFSLVGPFTGPFIDRFSRRSILVGSSVVRTGLILLLLPAVSWPEPVLLALAVATVSVNRFYHATKNAVLPTVVSPDQYLGANAVSSTAGMVFALAGAVIGGPLTDAISPRVPILLAAACAAGSAVAAARMRLPRGERRGLTGIVRELRDNLRDVREGLRVLLGSPTATYAVSSTWAMRALHGFIILAALVVGRARFDIGASGFSVVLAAVGVGGFVGALLVPAVARRVGRPGVAPVAFVLAGVATLVGGPLSLWAAILAAVGLAGTAMTATKIASDTIIMRSIPDHYRGRAFAVYDIGYNGVFVLAALIPTLLVPVIGETGVVLVAGTMGLVGAALLARWRRRLGEDLEVRAYAGGRADESPRELVIGGREVEVAEVERSWHEERDEERLLVFVLRLEDGRRVQISRGESWKLDRFLEERG